MELVEWKRNIRDRWTNIKQSRAELEVYRGLSFSFDIVLLFLLLFNLQKDWKG